MPGLLEELYRCTIIDVHSSRDANALPTAAQVGSGQVGVHTQEVMLPAFWPSVFMSSGPPDGQEVPAQVSFSCQ